jgi:antitoxin (DNA-binding transcriptional repressor) of toxin-antitoxin stability system
MAREVTIAQLRDDWGEITRLLERGESFVVTRDGVPVGEPKPLQHRRFVLAEAAVAAFGAGPPVDYERIRADLDALADPDTTRRG